MSEENVEKICAGYDAFNRGDHDAWIKQLHPEIVLHELPTSPDARVYRGHAEVRNWIESIWDVAGPGSRFEPNRFIEKDDLVVVWVHVVMFARESSTPIQTQLFHVHEME